MEKDYLIQKWLDNALTPQEFEAYKQLDEFEGLTKLSQGLQAFKAPHYDSDSQFDAIKNQLPKTKTKISWLKPALRIAAILVVALGLYFYTTTLNTTVTTLAANKTQVELPDHSTVNLNAKSTLVYNTSKWNKKREVSLEGEAFFKVAKGSKFDVKTPSGSISVLGTQFNIKQRDNYFEVICYEGRVAVVHSNKKTILNPGDSYLILDGKPIATEREKALSPSWLNNKSTFKSIPLKNVLLEMERQYGITISHSGVNANQLFTGSFTHDNLELALKQITLPFNLTYSITEKTVTLKRG